MQFTCLQLCQYLYNYNGYIGKLQRINEIFIYPKQNKIDNLIIEQLFLINLIKL